jgi:hypothetical protein
MIDHFSIFAPRTLTWSSLSWFLSTADIREPYNIDGAEGQVYDRKISNFDGYMHKLR